jgi:hypothetical protein
MSAACMCENISVDETVTGICECERQLFSTECNCRMI